LVDIEEKQFEKKHSFSAALTAALFQTGSLLKELNETLKPMLTEASSEEISELVKNVENILQGFDKKSLISKLDLN
jgi:UDP-N-acetylglucosamine 2-epimerase